MTLILYALRKFPKEFFYQKQRALVVILCVAVGVSSVAAVQIFGRSIIEYYRSNGQMITGGDLVVTTRRLSTEQLQQLAGAEGLTYTIVTTDNQVAFHPEKRKTMLVEIQGVDPEVYPLYGELVLQYHSGLAAALRDGKAVICQATQAALNADVGDQIWLGQRVYTVGDILLEQPNPQGAGLFGTVLVPLERETLVDQEQPMRLLFKLESDADLEAVANWLREVFPYSRVQTYLDYFARFEEAATRVNSFVLVVAMISLLLGGLGVASAAQVMMRQRLPELAIMKSVGGRTGQVIAYFLTQVLLLGLIGTGLGLFLGAIVVQLLPDLLGVLPIRPEFSVTLPVVFVSALLGLSVTLVFSLLPVVRGAYARPLPILKGEEQLSDGKRSRWQQGGTVLLLAFFFGLVVSYLVSSLRLGLGFVFAILILTGILWLMIRGLIRLVASLPIFWGRSGLLVKSSLQSQGGRLVASICVLTIGLGAVSVVLFLQQNVIGLLEETLQDARAYNIVIAGVPGEDTDSLVEFLQEHPGVEQYVEIASVRARARVSKEAATGVEPVQSSFILSLLGVDPADSYFSRHIVAGRDLGEDAVEEVVLRLEIAQRYGIELGDELLLELGTTTVRCVVVGVEESAEGVGIGVSFGQGAYVNKALIGQTDAEVESLFMARSPDGAAEVVNDLRFAFPKIALILDVGQLLDIFYRIFSAVTTFVQFQGLFSIVTGFVILAGSILLYKMERRREIAVIRCLGGDTRTLLFQYLAESGLTGLLAALLGIGTAHLVTWVLTTKLLSGYYRFDGLFSFGVGGGVIVLAAAIGFLSIVDVLREKPLTVLRNE